MVIGSTCTECAARGHQTADSWHEAYELALDAIEAIAVDEVVDGVSQAWGEQRGLKAQLCDLPDGRPHMLDYSITILPLSITCRS